MPDVVQLSNDEQIDLLTASFQRRNEPNFALGNMVSLFANIPGVRGFWPMSSMDTALSIFIDFSGQGRSLSIIGSPQAGYSNLAPIADFDGSNDYLTRSDESGLDIRGNETEILAGQRGLTIGYWVNTDNWQGANTGIIGKWNTTGNQRAYLLEVLTGTNRARFGVSVDGTATDFASGANTDLTIDTWHFIWGRFISSTNIVCGVDGLIETTAVGIPATLHNSTADFQVAAFNAGAAATRHDGLFSFGFLSACALSNAYLFTLYQQSRVLFGRG